MGQLEENLKLGLEAAKYAKEQVNRSSNQTYFKPWKKNRSRKRNRFILDATRGGSFVMDGNDDWVQDDEMRKRRRQLLQVLRSNVPNKTKESNIDILMGKWGERYFKDSGARYEIDGLRTNETFAKVTGKTLAEIEDIMDNGDVDALLDLHMTIGSAKKAMKFGVGNCQERAEIACMYLMDHAPGGVRLALYKLEEAHTGITGGEGDHVFAIYGLDAVTTKVNTLGPNAIVVDGWMNDAYPVRRHLEWKHGYNYNDERINLKQLTVRNMVCLSYRSHVECLRDFGVLPAGPGSIPVPHLKRTKF
jgi:hypothetical protein